MAFIYKIVSRPLWDAALEKGCFEGAPVDLSDGFIHFSTGSQLHETAVKHFSGQTNLLLLSVDETLLGPKLHYEVSRGGALFPHLYRALKIEEVAKVCSFEADDKGNFPTIGENQ